MRRRRLPSNPPPWWPEDEPWPPVGPPNARVWRHMRGRLFWRVGVIFLFLFFLSACGFTFMFWLIGAYFGRQEFLAGPPFGPPTFFHFWWLVPLVLVVAGFAVAGGALRHAAIPLGDLMEAAGRVAAGDYTTQIEERGPREVRALAHAFNEMTSRLSANDEQRRNLLADVTHELRTPLTVIQGNLEGLIDGVYPRDDSHLAPILDETRVMSRLIDDLRTLALAEAGALKLQMESTDLVGLMQDVVNSFQGQAEVAGVELRTEVATDLPLVQIDPERIRQVMENLTSNALRFTPPGGRILVSSTVDQSKRHVLVAVTDSGSGIPAEDLPHIFDRFFKSRNSRGMGLGLAIAKNLIAAHGGEIAAESNAGQGTTIRFTLPYSVL
jgi:signal transduction histidine kinase